MNMRPFGAEICVLVKLRGLKHVTNQCITTILGANLGAIGVYEHIFSHEYNRLQSVWVSRKRTITLKGVHGVGRLGRPHEEKQDKIGSTSEAPNRETLGTGS